MRAAVVGHVEWVQFIYVPRLPVAGEIVHAVETNEVAAGGGAVAAVQLARLAGAGTLFTAVGADAVGRRALEELSQRGLRVEAAVRDDATRRAVTFIDGFGERTITVIGERLAPRSDDDLPWAELRETDAVYLTAGDSGAVQAARQARVLVATARVLETLVEAEVRLDAVVASDADPAESFSVLDFATPPRLAVWTRGSEGGRYSVDGGPAETFAAPAVTAPIVDRYGAGDSFAGGLTFALARGDSPRDAVAFASRCGAAVLAGRGPYATQLMI